MSVDWIKSVFAEQGCQYCFEYFEAGKDQCKNCQFDYSIFNDPYEMRKTKFQAEVDEDDIEEDQCFECGDKIDPEFQKKIEAKGLNDREIHPSCERCWRYCSSNNGFSDDDSDIESKSEFISDSDSDSD